MEDEKSSAAAVASEGASSDGNLYAALYDLRQATEEASEEGFPTPSDNALANANRLLKATVRDFPAALRGLSHPGR